MKLSLFNKPHLGLRAGFDPLAIFAGIGAISGVAISFPWYFIGG